MDIRNEKEENCNSLCKYKPSKDCDIPTGKGIHFLSTKLCKNQVEDEKKNTLRADLFKLLDDNLYF